MAHSKYEVILQLDVPNLGKSGEMVKVRPGFARNYLIPNQIAIVATARNRSQIEHQQRTALARAAKLHASAEAIAKQLGAITVTIPMTAGEEDRLYGAVTSRDIAKALAPKGVELDHRTIQVEPIKRLGSYDVTAKVGTSVTATFKVEIVRK